MVSMPIGVIEAVIADIHNPNSADLRSQLSEKLYIFDEKLTYIIFSHVLSVLRQ